METQFLGSRKAKLWTYLILGILLVVTILIVNFVLVNPEAAQQGFDAILGLPAWAFPALGGVLGVALFWVGLKIETDWPEFVGAVLIAGSVAAAEVMLGWSHFELGGIGVIPYLIPVVLFLVLLIIAMAKSR
jgi:hypothetical protein